MSVFEFEPFKSYFPTPTPFSSLSLSDVCLCAYAGRTFSTFQMHAVCWNHSLIEYDQKKLKTVILTIHEGRNPNSSSQSLKISISMPIYYFMKGMSKRNQCLLPLNLPTLYDKIWFNGSISNSFTESYLDGLPHVIGSPTRWH